MINIEYKKIKEKDEYAITKIDSDERCVYLPDEYKGLKVTKILSNCFFDAQSIFVTNLPKYINYIDTNAFYHCNDLLSVYHCSNCIHSLDNISINKGNSNLISSEFINESDIFKKKYLKN